jgi:hypothetical protein
MASLLILNLDYYNTVCLSIVLKFCIQVIKVIKIRKLLYLVKINIWPEYYLGLLMSRKFNSIIEGSINSNLLFYKNNGIKSLETIRVDVFNFHDSSFLKNKEYNYKLYLDKIKELNLISERLNLYNDDQFTYWLAGLIDGDGCLLINKNKAMTCEITVHERDVKVLFDIKEKY